MTANSIYQTWFNEWPQTLYSKRDSMNDSKLYISNVIQWLTANSIYQTWFNEWPQTLYTKRDSMNDRKLYISNVIQWITANFHSELCYTKTNGKYILNQTNCIQTITVFKLHDLVSLGQKSTGTISTFNKHRYYKYANIKCLKQKENYKNLSNLVIGWPLVSRCQPRRFSS